MRVIRDFEIRCAHGHQSLEVVRSFQPLSTMMGTREIQDELRVLGRPTVPIIPKIEWIIKIFGTVNDDSDGFEDVGIRRFFVAELGNPIHADIENAVVIDSCHIRTPDGIALAHVFDLGWA